jgi:hypothetical protein
MRFSPFLLPLLLLTMSLQVHEKSIPIFDDQSLDGSNVRLAKNPKNWSVIDGGIIGKGVGQESYLMFKDQLGDFELEFSSHLPKEGNTGLEARSQTAKRLEKGVVGFQRHSGTKMTAEFENISLKRTK